jgi:putative ABC transport system substrate-binding protein
MLRLSGTCGEAGHGLGQGGKMKRRAFVAGLGAAAVWPSLTFGQQSPTVGFLSTRGQKDSQKVIAAFAAGLKDAGFIEGNNVAVEYRFAEGRLDLLPELATDLVRRPVTLLAAVGGSSSALAARAATSTIPIVFVIGGDPVGLGLAASLSHPGGNATGMTIISAVLGPKRLGLLREFVPKGSNFAAIVNPNTPEGRAQAADMRTAAQGYGLNLRVLEAGNEREIDGAFAALKSDPVDALFVGSDPIYDVHRDRIVALVAATGIPAIYQFRDYAAAGGLMSYDPDLVDAHRKIGVYAGQILKGAKPAELPIQQPTKFNFVIKLKTAKAQGLEVPPTLLAQADEVIE